MMAGDNREWLAVQVGAKFTHCPNQGKALALSNRVITLHLGGQKTASVRNNTVATLLALSQNSTDFITAGIGSNFRWSGHVKMG